MAQNPLDAFLEGRQFVQQQGQQQIAQAQGLMGILAKIKADEQAAQMRPLQMQLLQSQVSENEAQAAERQAKLPGILRQQQATGALASLLSSGGYTGPTSAPTAVATNDADALRMVQEAEAQGRPLGVNVPNPANVRALGALADPQEFTKSLFREPPKPTPFTLGPGQTRYDAAGNTLQSVPDRPREAKTYPIVQTADGVFERRPSTPDNPSGLVRLNDPGTNQPLRPNSIFNSGNNQAMSLRKSYDANPEVRLANSLEPKVGPMADYVASVGKGMGNSVGDAELVKLWLMTTHPKGDQISNLDYRVIEKMPDLWGRVKNVAGNFVFGKTLDAETRASMWKSIAGKYGAVDTVRKGKRTETLKRAQVMGLDENAIFPKEE